MLNFDWTFLALVVNFLVLLFVLNAILFRPLLKVIREREETVKGNLDAARDMSNKREESISALGREISEARSKAKDIFDGLRAEGVSRQKEVHVAAEAEASSILEKARAEIRAEAEKARNSLRGDIDRFSDEIVRKLVKV
jgi:F-type H+-transporting ATPase subunit b